MVVLFCNNGLEDDLGKDGRRWYHVVETQITCWHVAPPVQTEELSSSPATREDCSEFPRFYSPQ
jgi:hypothetical protein